MYSKYDRNTNDARDRQGDRGRFSQSSSGSMLVDVPFTGRLDDSGSFRSRDFNKQGSRTSPRSNYSTGNTPRSSYPTGNTYGNDDLSSSSDRNTFRRDRDDDRYDNNPVLSRSASDRTDFYSDRQSYGEHFQLFRNLLEVIGYLESIKSS